MHMPQQPDPSPLSAATHPGPSAASRCEARTAIAAALALALVLGAVGAACAAETAVDEHMHRLALRSGCMACHQVDRAPAADSHAPIGPPWREVALQYRGDSRAAERLTRTVLKGTSLHESHWKGRVAGLAMPPNAVAIGEAEARALVDWILQLPAKP